MREPQSFPLTVSTSVSQAKFKVKFKEHSSLSLWDSPHLAQCPSVKQLLVNVCWKKQVAFGGNLGIKLTQADAPTVTVGGRG